MKIAVSTNDGLNMAPSFEKAEGFLIVTEFQKEIVHEEMRWKPETGKQDCVEQYSRISDCSYLFVKDISEPAMKYFSNLGILIITTDQKIVTNVIINYLDQYSREASNTCCCP